MQNTVISLAADFIVWVFVMYQSPFLHLVKN